MMLLEDARQCRELLHDGLSHAGVAGIIRMKTVGIRLVEHLGTSIVKREESRRELRSMTGTAHTLPTSYVLGVYFLASI